MLKKLEKRTGFRPHNYTFTPRYNIAPTQLAPVIFSQEEGPVLTMMRWGLIPVWAEEESVGNRMINARAETLMQKPTFKRPFQRQRCLVPADGFYEWKKTDSIKQPMRFVLKSDEEFAFAGLWDRWKKPDGDEIQSFTIITTAPNKLARTVHDRMPALLKPEHYEAWLDPKVSDFDQLQTMLAPYPDEEMRCYPVSRLVNNPRNEDPRCIVPFEGA